MVNVYHTLSKKHKCLLSLHKRPHRISAQKSLWHISRTVHSINQKQVQEEQIMSDLAATSCCNNDCGCGVDNRAGGNSWLWIIILLFCCGGYGGSGNFLSTGDDCSCIILILLLLCCCGGNASAAERPSLLNGGRPESSGRLLFIVDFSVFSEYIPDQPHRSYLLPQ